MTRRLALAALSAAALILNGCFGGASLNEAVLGYDHTVSRLEREILLYTVADTPWDRQAFTLLYQLFQMTVTDVAGVGVPITISK
jgi:hypothetical protein